MKRESIYVLMGQIREEYVLEAEPARLKALIPEAAPAAPLRKRHILRGAAVAAAVLVCTAAVGFGTLTALTRSGRITEEKLPLAARFPALQAFLWPDGEETAETPETTETAETDPPCDHVLHSTDGSDPSACFTGGTTTLHCDVCNSAVPYTPQIGAHIYRDGTCMLCGMTEGAHTAFTVQADPDEVSGGIPAGVMLTGLSGDLTDTLRLPNVGYLEGYGVLPVTAIGELSLSFLPDTPTEIILPDTVKRIGNQAFYFIRTLKRVNLPDGLTSIGDEAFYKCDLTSLTLPEGVTALGESALRDNKSLKEVHLPASLVSIGDFAMRGCPALSEVTVPAENTVYYVETGCLIKRSSGKLILGVNGATIPKEGIHIIGVAAFQGRKNLGYVRIPDSVRQIQDDAFRDCKGLTSFHFPEGSTLRLGDRILFGCEDMTKIYIDCNIQTIGEDMFHGCFSLEEIMILDNIVQWQKQCIRTGIDKQLP